MTSFERVEFLGSNSFWDVFLLFDFQTALINQSKNFIKFDVYSIQSLLLGIALNF